MPDAVLAALILLPVVITYAIKSNAALGYLALCTGFVLSTSVIGDLKHLLSETDLSITNDTLALILIAFPYIATLFLARKAHAKGMMLGLNLVAALLGGALLALSVGPLLNSTTNFDVLNSNIWTQLDKYQSAIIGAGAFLSLVLVWLGGSHKAKKH